VPDLDLEAIKARDALWELWGDQYARMVRLPAAERDALVAEVERLRAVLRSIAIDSAASTLTLRRRAHAGLHPQEQTDA
jgi:hypothetical protein